MLGYVKVNKGELKVKEFELYKGLYCSLCKTLGREYGQPMRMILSYDVTFLVVVLLCVQNLRPALKKGVCPFNPLKKCNYCTNCNEQFSYGAAVSVMLLYFKIKDDIADSSFFRRILMYILLPYVKRKFKKASGKYPSLALDISVLMMEQENVEKENTSDVDKAADASAQSLGKIFSWFSPEDKNLYSFGYSVGRWVYLMDAADDIEKDLKNNSYNVFINRFKIEKTEDYSQEIREQIKEILNGSIAPATEYLDNIQMNFLIDIVNNVLYYGTPFQMRKILRKDLKGTE